jgi:hypothetical protein
MKKTVLVGAFIAFSAVSCFFYVQGKNFEQEMLKERVVRLYSEEVGWNYPYLTAEQQDIAEAVAGISPGSYFDKINRASDRVNDWKNAQH